MKLLWLLIAIPITIHAQGKVSAQDSVAIKKRVEGFYAWYAELIETNELNNKFNPAFVKTKKGMTALDFKNYRAGLKNHKFTAEFIERKVKEYTTCVENLKRVPYDTFLTYELDEMEDTHCDFSNVYEWSGGMDPISGAEVVKLNRMESGEVEALFRFRSVDGSMDLRDEMRKFILIKRRGEWEINDFK